MLNNGREVTEVAYDEVLTVSDTGNRARGGDRKFGTRPIYLRRATER
jgi:hypothetical protein